MKKIVMLLLLCVMLTALPVACTGNQSAVLGQVVQSDKPRVTAPAVAQDDMTALADGNNAFAFDLFQQLRQESGNLFYSPYSISEALAMTYAGAAGDTATSMADTMHFTLPQNTLHPAFNNLDQVLEQRGEGAQGIGGEGFKLHIANAIWGQSGFAFESAFLDTLAQNYGAGLRLVDFIDKTEESRVTINDWVSDETEGKIKDLIPEGSLNELTRLVLTNAIYFNAAWAYQFNEDLTKDGTFHTLDAGDITVPMMHQSEQFKYTESSNYQAVELPYDGGQMAMDILLPAAGQYEAFEQSLTAAVANNILDDMHSSEVIFTMPKFEFEAELGLKDALSKLGMAVAFSDGADFSGMDGKKDLFIQDVLHKAYIKVNEEGTEAAAASAVIVGQTSMPAEQYTMTCDRPFIFIIRDIPTNSIIFIGRVLTAG